MIIDNENIKLKSILKEWIDKSDEVMICSPFITTTDILFDLMESNIKFTLICRLSFPATPTLFSKLLDFPNTNKSIYVYDDNSLHSKIYLFRRNKISIAAIIGSSNFTNSGIFSNKEYNILMTEGFEQIEKYFKHIIKDSLCKLDQPTINYYNTFYKPVELNERFKRAKISIKLSDKYSNILDKFNYVKGILENENNTVLPFTYVFDAFAHFFKIQIIKDYELLEFSKFNKKDLKKYFNIFVNDYFDNNDLANRQKRFIQSQKIMNNLNAVSDIEIRSFFLGIHSIANGPGSGVRIKNIKNIHIAELKELLNFIINSNLNMSHKYSIALTDNKKNGLRVRFIGESAVGEIPGWLIPEEFPIINGKLEFIFDFFKIVV
jgi:HKD family nuclease